MPQGTFLPICVKPEATTGKVWASVVVNISAIINSFQIKTKLNAKAPIKEGYATGNAIFRKISYGLYPSTSAASSTSIGTCLNAGTDNQTVEESDNNK